MKKLFLFFLISLVGAAVWSARPTGFDGGDGDLFPWPWGTECPFPWQQIEGVYKVKTVKSSGPHANHYLRVSVQQTDDSGIQFLSMTEYDQRGRVYASGQGYAQENERIVKGLLRESENDRSYTVKVRSYARERNASCSNDLITAITFCPLRKKCISETSYILEPQ